jgi:UDP-4-amino-4,6-dideoxy-N-acetyl-beta-L-altrosamine transaminase
MIPYGRQDIDQSDIDAVVSTLTSDFLTQGPAIEAFENAMAAYCGASHAVALCNATAALHVACLALGLGPGKRLWTSPITFVASANCGRYCGASIDFVDIDARTYNMDVGALSSKLERAARENALPDIVIPVHFAGQSSAMREIGELAARYGFAVIEDASHAVGADYLGGKVGNCRFADATVFSFHPVKLLTTGEGGLVLTNLPEVARRVARLRSHGITRAPSEFQGDNPGGWYHEQIELGFNYRMTDIQAALGSSQLLRLDKFLARRRELAKRYDDHLANEPLTRPWQNPDGISAYHLYPVWVDPGADGQRRGRIFQQLRAVGIGVQVHYIPVHTQPYYRAQGFKPGDFPNAERYYSGTISLPLFTRLSDVEQDVVVSRLREFLRD